MRALWFILIVMLLGKVGWWYISIFWKVISAVFSVVILPIFVIMAGMVILIPAIILCGFGIWCVVKILFR